MSVLNSKWTMIYGDADDNGLFYYLRLIPDMDLEKSGFPHGLSITGNHFKSQEEAMEMAKLVDNFMDNMTYELTSDEFHIIFPNKEDYILNPWDTYNLFMAKEIKIENVVNETNLKAVLTTNHGSIILEYNGSEENSAEILNRMTQKIIQKEPPKLSWS